MSAVTTEDIERIFPEPVSADTVTDGQYKIVNLKAQNFLKLKAVDITPGDASVIEISGKNGAGKSSVLKAIWSVFANREISKTISSPIRTGEESGSVSVDLGDMTITRSWTGSDTYLRIENKAGAVYRSPQALLDKLKTSLSFDPLAFTRMAPKDQRSTLLKIIGVDLDRIDQERDGYFNARTETNRIVKTLTAQLEQYQALPADLPGEPISAANLINKIREAEENNREVTRLDDEITRAENQIVNLEAELKKVRNQLESSISARDTKSPVDVSTFESQLSNVEELNALIQKRNARDKIVSELNAASTKSDGLTTKIEDLDKSKKEALKSATLPIPDISITTEGITYQDIPLSQCSSAEQIRVSVAMGAALNPGLRVLLIQDGSLCDSTSRQIIEDLAQEQNMQVWIETVDNGESGIIIEDGEIVS